MNLLYVKLTEHQEQPKEVKQLPVRRCFEDWIVYECESKEQAETLIATLKSRGYEVEAHEAIQVIPESIPIERTIFLKLNSSAEMPECLQPFYSGGKVSKTSVYQFRFKTAQDAQDMLATLVGQGVQAWMRDYVEY